MHLGPDIPIPSARRSPRRAFTLIEIVVVLVIMGILATLTIPRLASTRKTGFDLFVNQVSDLMLMFAQRDGLGRQGVGLTIVSSPGRNELRLVRLDTSDLSYGEWVADPLVRPVVFPDFVDPAAIEVYADGEVVDIRGWVLGHIPGENRPTIEISIEDVDRRYSATVSLSPYSIAPRRRDGRRGATGRTTIDLDAEGRSREDW